MRATVSCLGILFASFFALAQEVDIPLQNWTVPPYAAPSTGGIHAMVDVSGPRAFVPVQPCRVADTRGNGAPITGGILGNSEARTWSVGGICGIPNGLDAAAISVNFTVVSAPATPQGAFLLAWPTGSPPANPVAVITYGPGTTILSNAAIVPISAGEQLTINVSHSTHVIMDVNGYFSDTITGAIAGSSGFYLETTAGYAGFFKNKAAICTGNCGLVGVTQSTGAASGVSGLASVGGNNSAGVLGRVATLAISGTLGIYNAHGVRGEGALGGVLGISPYEGVAGSLVNSSGSEIAYGVLGLAAGIATDPGCPSSPCSGPWGVFAHANIGATGAKYFLDPHPTDPSRAIGYISLEGPEAGTYFRGRARFQNGTARVPVPEHFRLVTAPDGLTVQITPIGEMATVAVVRMDLHEIVVKASRNVEFSYLVQGVRETHKEISPFRGSGEFAPRFADSKIPDWLSPAQKRRLIENGTYRENGTVNLETARRLGWDRIWEERSRPAPQPTEP